MPNETDYTSTYFYNENNILMIIERYLVSKGQRFYYQIGINYEHKDTVFSASGDKVPAAFILKKKDITKDEWCYTNQILAGPMSYMGFDALAPQDVKVAIEMFLNKQEKLQICEIIFPYEPYALHWALGKITIDSTKKEAFIEIFDPFNPHCMASDDAIKSLKSTLEGYEVGKVDVEKKYRYQMQQFDGSSCGVITAENAKSLFDKNMDKFKISYEAGAKEIRKQHLTDVGNNKYFTDWLVQGETKLRKIIALENDIWKAWEDFAQHMSDAEKAELQKIKYVKPGTSFTDEEGTIAEEENRGIIRLLVIAKPNTQIYRLLYKKGKDGDDILIDSGADQVNHICREISRQNQQKQPKEQPQVRNESVVGSAPKILDSKPGDLRKNTHGDMYQLALTGLVAARAKNLGKKFNIYGEAAAFEKFDDLVIDYGDSITFLQAKHNDKDNESYDKTAFCSDKEGDASLAKYFDSWYRLKQKLPDKKCRFIFFTNRGVTNQTDLEELFLSDDEYKDFSRKDKSKTPQTYQFKEGATRKNYKEAINDYSVVINEIPPTIKVDGRSKLSELEKRKIKDYVTGKLKCPEEIEPLINAIKAGDLKVDVTTNGGGNLPKSAEQYLVEKWNGIKVEVAKFRESKVTKKSDYSTEINDFLDEFVLKVEQPPLKEIMTILMKEMGGFTDIGAEEFANDLWYYLVEWFARNDTSLLTCDEFGGRAKVSVDNLKRFYLLGDTKRFSEEADKLFDNYRDYPEVGGVEEFLTTTKQNIFCISAGQSAQHMVYKNIRSYIRNNTKDAEWFYISAENDKELEIARGIIAGPATQFIMIDCRNQVDLRKLRDLAVTVNQTNKKLILLVNENHRSIYQDLSIVGTDIIVNHKPQLSQAEMSKLIAGKQTQYISVAGKQITLSEMLSNQSSGLFKYIQKNLDILLNLIKNSSSDKAKVNTYMPEDVYEPNDVIKGVPYYNLVALLSNPQISSVEIAGDDQVNKAIKIIQKTLLDQDQKNNQERKSELISKINKESENKIVISFVDKDKDSVFVQNHEKINGLIPEGYDFTKGGNVVKPDFLSFAAPKSVAIFSANAGYGKTSLAYEIRRQWMEGELNLDWVIRVNLPKIDVKKLSQDDFTTIFDGNSTDSDWSDWQLSAFKYDLDQKNKKILIIADGFDEVKTVDEQEKINSWLASVSSNVSMIVNTRPYAASKIKIPNGRAFGGYFTLAEYGESQRKGYVKKYLEVIFTRNKNSLDQSQKEQLIEQISAILSSQSRGSIIGIPLETYLFCSSLEAELVSGLSKKSDVKTLLSEGYTSNTLVLYQNFVKNKLTLFMLKHINMQIEVSFKQPHRLFSLSSSYTDLISVFAFSQAFGETIEQRNARLDEINYTEEVLEELNDLGIFLLEKNENEVKLRFLHATYQDYFAAIYLLRKTIIANDVALAKKVQEKMYDPNYRMIFMFASMIVEQKDKLVSNLKTDQQRVSYWKKYFTQGFDMLGEARDYLLTFCTKEIDRAKLEVIIALPEKVNEIDDFAVEDVGFLYEQDKVAKPLVLKYSNIQEAIKDKNRVLQFVQNYYQQGRDPQKILDVMEEICTNYKLVDHYWDIDGGFKAMAYLGKYFSQKFEDFFIERVKGDPSWRANHALDALLILNAKSDNNEHLYPILFEIIRATDKDQMPKIKFLLSQHYEKYWLYVKQLFEDRENNTNIQISQILEGEILDDEFDEYLKVIFLSAYITKSAVLVADDYSSITIDGVCRTEIQITNRKQQEICKLLVKDLQQNQANRFKALHDFKPRIAGPMKEVLKVMLLSELSQQSDFRDQIKELVKDGSKVALFYELISQANLTSQYNAELKAVAKQHSKMDYKFDNWSINGGIKAVGFLGAAFNKDFADFLIKRSSMWDDNIWAVVEALKNLRQDLLPLAGTGEASEAIAAYNESILDKHFARQGLEKIEALRADLRHISTQTESNWAGRVAGERRYLNKEVSLNQ